jgi:hypothetical protein
LKRLLSLFSIAFLLGTTAQYLHGQAAPTAIRNSSIQLGAGYSFAKPDYGQKKIQGYTIYGTYNFTRHWGIEGDIHRIDVITPTDIGQDSYLLGPRYSFRFGRFMPYGKGLLGLGTFKTDYDPRSNRKNFSHTYKMWAAGGGVDMMASRHWNIRLVDFEYQNWPGFANHGLTPYVFTFGAAYTFR